MIVISVYDRNRLVCKRRGYDLRRSERKNISYTIQIIQKDIPRTQRHTSKNYVYKFSPYAAVSIISIKKNVQNGGNLAVTRFMLM